MQTAHPASTPRRTRLNLCALAGSWNTGESLSVEMSTLTVAAAVVVVLGVVDGGVGNVGNGAAGRLLLVPVMPREGSPVCRVEEERRGLVDDGATNVGGVVVMVVVAAAIAMARRAFMALLCATRRRLLRF